MLERTLLARRSLGLVGTVVVVCTLSWMVEAMRRVKEGRQQAQVDSPMLSPSHMYGPLGAVTCIYMSLLTISAVVSVAGYPRVLTRQEHSTLGQKNAHLKPDSPQNKPLTFLVLYIQTFNRSSCPNTPNGCNVQRGGGSQNGNKAIYELTTPA